MAVLGAQIKRMPNKTRQYNIDSRVANEFGITHKQANAILDLFFEILKEECSLLEDGEQIAYKWLKLKCKKTSPRVIHPGMIGYRGDGTPYTVQGKLKLNAKVMPSFYADAKKGIESNWGA